MQTLGFTLLCAVYGALLVWVLAAPPASLARALLRDEVAPQLRALQLRDVSLPLLRGHLAVNVFTPGNHRSISCLRSWCFWLLAIGDDLRAGARELVAAGSARAAAQAPLPVPRVVQGAAAPCRSSRDLRGRGARRPRRRAGSARRSARRSRPCATASSTAPARISQLLARRDEVRERGARHETASRRRSGAAGRRAAPVRSPARRARADRAGAATRGCCRRWRDRRRRRRRRRRDRRWRCARGDEVRVVGAHDVVGAGVARQRHLLRAAAAADHAHRPRPSASARAAGRRRPRPRAPARCRRARGGRIACTR